MKYKIRVSTSIEAFKEWLRQFKIYAYCLETGHKTGKDHMHVYVEIPDIVPLRTIRSQLRATCGSGNQVYSLKQIKDKEYPLEYLSYMLKDGKVYSKGIPKSVFVEAKKYKSYKSKQLWEKINVSECNSEADIIHAIMQYYYDNKVAVRRFQLQSVFDTICLQKYGPSGGRWDAFFR